MLLEQLRIGVNLIPMNPSRCTLYADTTNMVGYW